VKRCFCGSLEAEKPVKRSVSETENQLFNPPARTINKRKLDDFF